METQNQILINYLLAFIEGLVLILSPCILPILPIILSGAIEGGKMRPAGIILGFIVVFALFSLFARALVQHLGINLNLLRIIAYAIIIVFGFVIMIDYLSEKFSQFTQKLANLGENASEKIQGQGFVGGLILGGLVSLIWVPCAGPVLAAAIIQTAVQQNAWESFFTFLSFAIGSILPMIFIAFLGKKLILKFNFLKTHNNIIRKILGALIVIGALIAAIAGSKLALFSSSLSTNTSKVLTSLFINGDKQGSKNNNTGKINMMNLGVNGIRPYPAPPLIGGTAWINSLPLMIDALKGKVVLIDFWTYSCINCIRTLPYLKNWYEKYSNLGFVIIGVHTPEFEFEKNINNVKEAVEQFGIKYPVVLDNNYSIWMSYKNQYWPAHYLINQEGQVIYQHFGEGSYEETEENIRKLLNAKESEEKLHPNSSFNSITRSKSEYSFHQTPETYLGYARANNYAGQTKMVKDIAATYHYPENLSQSAWGLRGKWIIKPEKIISAEKNAAIKIHFNASKIYVVMGSDSNGHKKLKVFLNGELIEVSTGAGRDVKKGIVDVKEHKLYEVVNFDHSQSGILEIIVIDEGIEFYTFTFG